MVHVTIYFWHIFDESGLIMDHSLGINLRPFHILKTMRSMSGDKELICFSVQGHAAEQGIIFRIPTPGPGIIFVNIGSTTGSIFIIFDPDMSL